MMAWRKDRGRWKLVASCGIQSGRRLQIAYSQAILKMADSAIITLTLVFPKLDSNAAGKALGIFDSEIATMCAKMAE